MAEADKLVTFKEWVNAHSDVLYGYTLKHGFDEHSAKDLLQETFFAAWRGMDGYDGRASVRNWLFVILKNKITDHFRRVAGKANMELIYADHNDHAFFDELEHWRHGAYPQTYNVDFTNKVESADFYRVFTGCSSKLKQIYSAVFVMKYVDDKSSEEICKELGITSSNYWVILHRAKVQLRACLEKHWLK